MNTAEVSEILNTYPDVLRDITLEIVSLQYDLDSLQNKKIQMEKDVMVKLYQEYPPIRGQKDPSDDIRKDEYYRILHSDMLYRTLRQDIQNIEARLTSLEVNKEFYSNKLRATIALVNVEVDRGSTLR